MEDYNVMKIKLTGFFDAHVTEGEDLDGNIVKGVFIPLDKNNLHINRYKEVNAWFYVNKTNVASIEEWTHYVQMKSSKDFMNKMAELGYKMPKMGNLKPSNFTPQNKYHKPIKLT